MLKPLSDRVLIKILEKEEKTKNGIILGNNNDENSLNAEVVEVGKGTEKNNMEVKKGDKVIIPRYAGTEIKVEGEKYLIIKQEDILGIII